MIALTACLGSTAALRPRMLSRLLSGLLVAVLHFPAMAMMDNSVRMLVIIFVNLTTDEVASQASVRYLSWIHVLPFTWTPARRLSTLLVCCGLFPLPRPRERRCCFHHGTLASFLPVLSLKEVWCADNQYTHFSGSRSCLTTRHRSKTQTTTYVCSVGAWISSLF